MPQKTVSLVHFAGSDEEKTPVSYEVAASLVETWQISRSFVDSDTYRECGCMKMGMSKCCASRAEKYVVTRAERKRDKVCSCKQ
jgi:hypothetical protein